MLIAVGREVRLSVPYPVVSSWGQVCFTLALSLPDESRDGLVVLAGLSTLLVVRRGFVSKVKNLRSG